MFKIPPYYKKPSFQRFFAGVIIGSIISWGLFLYLFGEANEHQIQRIHELKLEITDLKKTNQLLIEDKEQLNNNLKQKLVVQNIIIKVSNAKDYKLSGLTTLTLEKSIKQEINHLINKDIENVASNLELLKKAIQNKPYDIDGTKINVKVEETILTTELKIKVNIVNLETN